MTSRRSGPAFGEGKAHLLTLFHLKKPAINNNFIYCSIQACYPTCHVWLGASDAQHESLFVCNSDGSNVNLGYTNWAEDEPNNGINVEENCLSKNKAFEDQKWSDRECEHSLFVLCETV